MCRQPLQTKWKPSFTDCILIKCFGGVLCVVFCVSSKHCIENEKQWDFLKDLTAKISDMGGGGGGGGGGDEQEETEDAAPSKRR